MCSSSLPPPAGPPCATDRLLRKSEPALIDRPLAPPRLHGQTGRAQQNSPSRRFGKAFGMACHAGPRRPRRGNVLTGPSVGGSCHFRAWARFISVAALSQRSNAGDYRIKCPASHRQRFVDRPMISLPCPRRRWCGAANRNLKVVPGCQLILAMLGTAVAGASNASRSTVLCPASKSSRAWAITASASRRCPASLG